MTAVKPIDGFSARWDKVLARAQSWSDDKTGHRTEGGAHNKAGEEEGGRPFRVVVVGGGAGGVELALAMQYRLLPILHPHATLPPNPEHRQWLQVRERVLMEAGLVEVD